VWWDLYCKFTAERYGLNRFINMSVMSLFINGIVISVHWYVQWPVKQLITHINLFTRSSCCCDAYACSLACLWRHWSDDTFLGRNENKHESDYFSAKGKKTKMPHTLFQWQLDYALVSSSTVSCHLWTMWRSLLEAAFTSFDNLVQYVAH